PKIKSGNYLNNVIARMQAADEDAVEGIMLNPEGWVTEGTTSNIWMVKGGKAKTPALRCGLLPGVTRALVLELASTNGIPVEECEISREELLDAEEAFITSTTKGVVPIRLIGDTAVGNGKPGPITKRLGQLLREREQAN
ncbi:MAG: aminotransferase class IV, partial [Planctomycetota bacterium]|nr:aminotransferase class IV [Planctomycetota bacterium]